MNSWHHSKSGSAAQFTPEGFRSVDPSGAYRIYDHNHPRKLVTQGKLGSPSLGTSMAQGAIAAVVCVGLSLLFFKGIPAAWGWYKKRK